MHPGAHVNIHVHLQASVRVYEYCYRLYSTCSVSSIQCPRLLLVWACLLQHNRYGLSTYGYTGKVIHPTLSCCLLQQHLPLCRALYTTTDAPHCILHVQGGALYSVPNFIGELELLPSHQALRSVKVVYRIVWSSACNDRSTGNAIWNLLLVTSKIPMSM